MANSNVSGGKKETCVPTSNASTREIHGNSTHNPHQLTKPWFSTKKHMDTYGPCLERKRPKLAIPTGWRLIWIVSNFVALITTFIGYINLHSYLHLLMVNKWNLSGNGTLQWKSHHFCRPCSHCIKPPFLREMSNSNVVTCFDCRMVISIDIHRLHFHYTPSTSQSTY
jgi:hypothetical protein